jgi:O-antigen ligase
MKLRPVPLPPLAVLPPPDSGYRTVDGISQGNAGVSGTSAFTFWICATYTFLLFSRTVEFIDTTGKLHLNLILGLICVVSLIATGNFFTIILARQGIWVSLFCFWLFTGLPFSTWRGGSLSSFGSVWLKSYITFLIVGGLIFTISQLRIMAVILALSTVSQVYLAFHGGIQSEDRLTMSYGSLGNSNDLASALLIGFPFMAFAMSDRKVNLFFRVSFIPLMLMLLVAVFKTGSRGALLAIGVLILFAFFRASAPNKAKIALVFLCGVALFAFVVPTSLRSRYMTIVNTDQTASTSEGDQSALESSSVRKGLLWNALVLMVRHPLFGVGLGNFSNQSFNLFAEQGVTGMWFTCHDIFGLVGAETGIPGLVFFVGIIVSSGRSLSKLSRVPGSTPELVIISRLGFTIMMALVAYTACGVFNTQAYSHQLPVLAALAAALGRIAHPYTTAATSPEPVPAFAALPRNRRISEHTLTG